MRKKILLRVNKIAIDGQILSIASIVKFARFFFFLQCRPVTTLDQFNDKTYCISFGSIVQVLKLNSVSPLGSIRPITYWFCVLSLQLVAGGGVVAGRVHLPILLDLTR